MTGNRDPDGLIDRAGVRPDTDQDQHFLVDDRVLERLPTYLPVEEPRHLLEVGAGTGALTDRLLETASTVTAIERDRRLAAFLRREFEPERSDGRLTILEGDALEVPLPDVDGSVSNLPYGVSSAILFRLLPLGRPLVATVQLEFAERMVAEAGTSSYGRLSVSSQHYAKVTIVEEIPPEAFRPPPAVESAVIRAVPREPTYEFHDEAFFLRFVKALFTQRRKTVRNAIRNTTHISGIDDPAALVDSVDDELLGRRPDAVEPAEFAAMAALAADGPTD